MPIEAKVICDSVTSPDHRLTTIEVTLHRFILAELNTHRVFSRNSASSRAIPVSKIIERVETDPALPVFWGKNQVGMQANEELTTRDKVEAITHWYTARNNAVAVAIKLIDVGLHKQLANRILEPFMWHTVIISSTEWDNFFRQRCHPAAQPEMRAAAEAIRVAWLHSTPVRKFWGEWHLPYVDPNEGLAGQIARKVSAARCARVSYLTHDGKRDVSADIALYDKLVSANPPHASPLEHVASPMEPLDKQLGNFNGWSQLRHQVTTS